MYPRRFSQTLVTPQRNLKNFILETHNGLHFFKYQMAMRQKLAELKDVNRRLQFILKNGKVFKMLQSRIEEFPRTSRNNPSNVLKVWARQCECVMAQRLRRCQQMFMLYSKWWEERALKEFWKKMRLTLSRKGKEFVLGAIGISSFNWDDHRIPEEEMKKHLNELEYITILKENTICLACEEGKKSNVNTHICKCGTAGKPSDRSYENWVPFIEQDDLIVWKRLHDSGLYEYKVYGSYNDVSAEDFLNVQVDIDYRRKWDTTAVTLQVAETDPTPDSNSDIVYWEMLWPRLFSNRDYVFKRRYIVDEDAKTIIIISKTTNHPGYPTYPDKYRVDDYWSCMVIKPYTDLKKPGIEFSLTYFDNPGVNIPSSVTTWVSMRAMPDFLAKLREATKKYREYCLSEGVSAACEAKRQEDKKRREEENKNKLDYCTFERIKTKLLKPEIQNRSKNKEDRKTENSGSIGKNLETALLPMEHQTPPTATVKTESNSVWKYFHPLYYFH